MVQVIDTLCGSVQRWRCAALAWWGAFVLSAAMLLLPLFVVDVPPLLDYPNHMARMYVLAAGQADPVLSKMYAAHWSIIPNLALDMLVPPLLTVLPLHVAGRIAVGAAILLPFVGCIALNRAVFGMRSYWPLLSGMASYNVALRLGFLNMLIGVGLALLLTSAWVSLRSSRPLHTICVTAAGAVAVFFCHIMALAFLALLLVCCELRRDGPMSRIGDRAGRAAVLALVFALPAILYAMSDLPSAWTTVRWLPLASKAMGAFGAFLCDSPPLDIAAALACLLFAYLCLRAGKGRLAPWLAIAMALLAIGYSVAPFSLKGSTFFSTRLSVLFGFLLFAGFVPMRLGPRAATAAFVVFLVLFTARTAVIAGVWAAHNEDLAEVRRVIRLVGPVERVLVVDVSEEEAPRYWNAAPRGRIIPFTFHANTHEAALLLTERHAFWPFLFASPGQQPLMVLPPYLRLSAQLEDMPPHLALTDPAYREALTSHPYLAHWQSDFDDVLLLDAGGEPDLAGWAGNRMDLLAATDAAALFRIRRPPPP